MEQATVILEKAGLTWQGVTHRLSDVKVPVLKAHFKCSLKDLRGRKYPKGMTHAEYVRSKAPLWKEQSDRFMGWLTDKLGKANARKVYDVYKADGLVK